MIRSTAHLVLDGHLVQGARPWRVRKPRVNGIITRYESFDTRPPSDRLRNSPDAYQNTAGLCHGALPGRQSADRRDQPMTAIFRPRPTLIFLLLLLVLVFWLSLALGPVSLPLGDTLLGGMRLLGLPLDGGDTQQAELILGQIRLPRSLLGIAVGSVLALSGVAMQGLFRNPLADPGLVGVSGGAALGAALAIVGGSLLGGLPPVIEPYLLSVCAFAGGLIVTAVVYRFGRRNGQTDVATMLLAGVAMTAMAGAGVGLFTYLADDATLRTLTFWNLGSLNGASYPRLWPLLIVTLGVALWLPRRAAALNALLLGESEARHLGFDIERIKLELVLCTALGVGAAVAAAGLIGFIGLVVPHLMRLLVGPDHRVLLPASLLAGASLLLLADLAARLLLAPAELPIGIVTALIGAPFFLYLLVRGRS
ncbi:Hemin transport system permease protein HmuU [compost metagenome]